MTKICTILRRAAFATALSIIPAFSLHAENVDFTDYIVNHSFESGLSGWTQSGMKLQNNSTFPLKDGNNYVERWVPSDNGADACSVTQDLSGLLPGSYTLTVAAQNLRETDSGIQTGVWIFAGDKKTDVNVVADYSVDFTVGANGTATVGYKAAGATGNYLAVDNFRLVYTKYNAADMAAFISKTCGDARALLASKMDKASAQAIETAAAALEATQASGDVKQISEALKTLSAAVTEANASIEAYKALADAIDTLAAAYEEIKDQQGAESIAALLEEARKTYADADATPAEAEELTVRLSNAILIYRIEHSTGAAPEVTTGTYVARGATFALGRSTVKAPSGVKILESGFCWSTSPDPTVGDYRSTKSFKHNGTIYHMKGLTPSTVYYVRAYAITTDYAVGYGEPVRVITIPKGTITYSYDPNGATDDVSARIIAATAEAVDYWNNSTSITGYHVSVSYNSGVNTADCSYGGWVRVGPRVDYQRTGTLMHEMNHGVGVGQHSVWFGPASPYRENGNTGLWLGSRATELVRFLQNDPAAMLHGDTQHMWPYGINGAFEDDGTEILYLANGLVTQAVGEDALPPVAGRFHTPSYFFPSQEGVKYYLKVESADSNAYTNFLVETDANELAWTSLTSEGAASDDHAAWYIDFDPVSCYYTFRNAATGNYLMWTPGQRTKAITAGTPGEGDITLFQLTGSVERVPVADRNEFTYWITVGQEADTPRALALSGSNNPFYTNYKISGSHTDLQRWHIITEAEMADFDKAAALHPAIAESESQFPADIYDLSGRIVRRNASSLDGLAPGFYLVGKTKVFVK